MATYRYGEMFEKLGVPGMGGKGLAGADSIPTALWFSWRTKISSIEMKMGLGTTKELATQVCQVSPHQQHGVFV
jgi:hypothetical protein